MQIEVVNNPPATPAQNALAMRIINHRNCPEFIGNLYNLRQRRNISLHTEYTVGDNKPTLGILFFGNLRFKVFRIAVPIPHDLGLRKASAINNTCMIEFVREDNITIANDCGNNSKICAESRLKGYRAFNSLKKRKFSFEFLVECC